MRVLFMQVTRRAHFDNACIKPWRNNKGTAVGAFDLWERASVWTDERDRSLS